MQFISIVMGLFSDGTLTIGPVLLVAFRLILTDSFCERERAEISIR